MRNNRSHWSTEHLGCRRGATLAVDESHYPKFRFDCIIYSLPSLPFSGKKELQSPLFTEDKNGCETTNALSKFPELLCVTSAADFVYNVYWSKFSLGVDGYFCKGFKFNFTATYVTRQDIYSATRYIYF